MLVLCPGYAPSKFPVWLIRYVKFYAFGQFIICTASAFLYLSCCSLQKKTTPATYMAPATQLTLHDAWFRASRFRAVKGI